MEKYAELISILLQHSQRFLDFWNFQIVVSLAVLGFIFADPKAMSRLRVRLGITALFLFIAVFTVYTLSTYQRREEALYAAIRADAAASPADFSADDMAYLDTLEPTSLGVKAGGLIVADMIVIAATWFGKKAEN